MPLHGDDGDTGIEPLGGGIVAPVGRKGVTELLHVVADPSDIARALPRSAINCSASRSRSWSSIG